MIYGVVVLVLGLVAVGCGIFNYRRFHRLARVAQVQGVITGHERRFTGKSNAYFPVVSFRTREEADVHALIPQGKIFSPPNTGRQVRVIYDPAKPETAYIYSPGLRYGWIVFVIIGAGFAALGIMGLVAP